MPVRYSALERQRRGPEKHGLDAGRATRVQQQAGASGPGRVIALTNDRHLVVVRIGLPPFVDIFRGVRPDDDFWSRGRGAAGGDHPREKRHVLAFPRAPFDIVVPAFWTASIDHPDAGAQFVMGNRVFKAGVRRPEIGVHQDIVAMNLANLDRTTVYFIVERAA